MQAYDVFMLTVLVAAAVWGAWKGLAWQIASIGSIGLSYFVSVNFRSQVAQFFHYQPPEYNNLLAMLVLYVGTTLVVWVAFNMFRDFLEKVQLKEFDRQIGGLLGLAKGIIIITLITLFTVGLGTESQRQAVIQSKSGYYITQLLKQIEPLVPQEYRRMVDDAIARLEDRNGLPRGSYFDGRAMSSATNSGGSWMNWGQQPQPANPGYWGASTTNNGWGTNQNSGGLFSQPQQPTTEQQLFQQLQNEIFARLQQSSGNNQMFTQENMQRVQAELQARMQQGQQNGGLFSPQNMQQMQNEIIARLQREATQPAPLQPPPRGFGS